MNALLILIILIVIAVIAFLVIKEITKVEVSEIINIPKIFRYQTLDVYFRYYTLDAQNDNYVFRAEITNNFGENVNIDLFSVLKIGKIEIANYKALDSIEPQKAKSYDITFNNIFDNSKISGLNFCEKEENIFQPLECSKNKACSNGVCLEDCRCYYLDKKSIKVDGRERNLYCVYSPVIENKITYSSKVKDILEVEIGEKESVKKLSVSAPFETYVYINPTPYNNLLPLELSFEFRGENVKIKSLRAKILNYTLIVSSFFGERREEIESQECNLDLNILVDGKVYSKRFGKYCSFNPVNIKVIERDKIQELNKSEEIRNLISRICKDMNESECSKELTSRAYSLCSIYNELEICKNYSEKLNTLKILIEIEFEKSEEYKRSIDVNIC